MRFLVLEDALRLLWPGEGDFVGWKASEEMTEGRAAAAAAPKPTKKRSGDGGTPAASAPRKPRHCGRCGQLQKGHVCTNPDPTKALKRAKTAAAVGAT